MIIQADKQGLDAIFQLCDIALKTGGMKNRDGVNLIVESLKELPPEIKAEPEIKQESNKETKNAKIISRRLSGKD